MKHRQSTWKAEFAISENTKITYNPYATLFMTFTLSGVNADRHDYKAMNKAWNAYVTNVLRHYLSSWILVKEQHKDGAWHIHIIANLPFEFAWRGEIDRQNMLNRKYASLCPKFRWLINLIRIRGYIYGFGFFNAEPSKYIGTKHADDQGKAMAHYISSYASKSLKFRCTKPDLKGKRLVSYGKASPRSLKVTILRLPPGVGSDKNKKGKRIAPIKTHYRTVTGPKIHLSYHTLGVGIRTLGIYNYWKWRAVAGRFSSVGGGRRFRQFCCELVKVGIDPLGLGHGKTVGERNIDDIVDLTIGDAIGSYEVLYSPERWRGIRAALTEHRRILFTDKNRYWGHYCCSVAYDPELLDLSPRQLVETIFTLDSTINPFEHTQDNRDFATGPFVS